MAKKKTPVKHSKKTIKKVAVEPAKIEEEPVVTPPPVVQSMPEPAKPHHEKKNVLLKGIAVHLTVYILIALVLAVFGVPAIIIFFLMAVLLWGLFVISYAFYFHK